MGHVEETTGLKDKNNKLIVHKEKKSNDEKS